MGIFTRSNSSASSRRTSQLVHVFSPTGENGESQGDFVSKGLCSIPRKCGPYSTTGAPIKPTGRQEGVNGRPDVVGPPSIPLRTSSKDAAIVNSLARSLVNGSRKLRSSASKLSLVSNMSTSTIWSTTSRDPDRMKSTSPHINGAEGLGQSWTRLRRSTSRAEAEPTPVDFSTASISSPSHFQHLTHALPQQFTKIASSTQSDLVADFSAVRASQNTRRELRGIKAVDLHSRNSSAETNTASLTPSEASSSQSSATLSMASNSSRNSFQHADQPSQFQGHKIHAMRSQESFSQPFSPIRSPRLSLAVAPLSPPPRRSSRKADTQYDHESHGSISSADLPSRRESSPPSALRQDAESSSTKADAAKYAIERPASLQRTHLPNDVLEAHGEWLISQYGKALSCVTEEDITTQSSGRPESVAGTREHLSTCSPRLDPCSSSSSSQISTATITPSNFAMSSIQEAEGASTTPAASSTTQRRSMQRSSLNNGLFTSWSFEDEPLRNQVAATKAEAPLASSSRILPGTSISARKRPASSRASRIPVRSAPASRPTSSHRYTSSA